MSLHNKIPDQINQGSVVHIHIINYIYVFLLLQISFYVLRLASRNLLLKRRKALSKVSFSFTITFDILHPTSLQSLQATRLSGFILFLYIDHCMYPYALYLLYHIFWQSQLFFEIF